MAALFGTVNTYLPFGLFHEVVAAMFAGTPEFLVIGVDKERKELPKSNFNRFRVRRILRRSSIGKPCRCASGRNEVWPVIPGLSIQPWVGIEQPHHIGSGV